MKKKACEIEEGDERVKYNSEDSEPNKKTRLRKMRRRKQEIHVTIKVEERIKCA